MCLQGDGSEIYQENIHNGVQSKNYAWKFILIAPHLMTLPKLPKSVIPQKRLRIVASAS